jgi:hypothetical protein
MCQMLISICWQEPPAAHAEQAEDDEVAFSDDEQVRCAQGPELTHAQPHAFTRLCPNAGFMRSTRAKCIHIVVLWSNWADHWSQNCVWYLRATGAGVAAAAGQTRGGGRRCSGQQPARKAWRPGRRRRRRAQQQRWAPRTSLQPAAASCLFACGRPPHCIRC